MDDDLKAFLGQTYKGPKHPMLLESNPKAQAVIAKAEGGDPAALKKIFECLTGYLEGEKHLPREFALFSARGFRELAQSEAMTEAGATYRANLATATETAKDESPKVFGVRKLLGLGPRLPEKQLREIGFAFRHAFRLRKVRGKRPTAEIVPLENPPHLYHPRSRQFLDCAALAIDDAARKGDPEALSLIWNRLAGHLLGEVDFCGGVYSYFCSRSLWAFTTSRAMGLAEVAFEEDGKLDIDSGLPQVGDLRRLERAFCRAMRLSKPKGKDLPRDLVWMPPLAQKAELLTLFGVSVVEAVKIASSTGSKMTPSSLDEWLRLAKNPAPKWRMTICGDPADPVLAIDDREEWRIDNDEPAHDEDLGDDPEPPRSEPPSLLKNMSAYDRLERQLLVAKLVNEEMAKGADLPSACEIVGRRVVLELVGLTGANMFLKASTVKRIWQAVQRRMATAQP